MQLKALEKSRKRPQGLLDVEESKWEVAWIIASQPPLTPNAHVIANLILGVNRLKQCSKLEIRNLVHY